MTRTLETKKSEGREGKRMHARAHNNDDNCIRVFNGEVEKKTTMYYSVWVTEIKGQH